MSYLVLARKWRPQSFEDLVGQEHVSRTLANAIAQNRVAHAFLFTGVRGVGKTTSARILAKALNCATGPTATPCLKCDACVQIAAGNDIDVQEIDGASYNGVDEVRKLQESIPYRPQRDRFKIFIVDEVHMLSSSAWNAFLKTLEEPPPHVKFIFATTEVHKVPITILSRCQRYDFKMISAQTVAARIKHVLSNESITADEAAVSLIARQAAGSMRDAMSLLDQAIAWAGQDLKGAEVAKVLGVASRSSLHVLAEAVVDGRAEDALRGVSGLAEQGFDLGQLSRDLLAHFRDLVVTKVCKDPSGLLDVADHERADIEGLAKRSDADDLVRIHQGFSKAFDDILRSPMPRAALEMTLVRLARRPPLAPVDVLVQRLVDLERRLAGAGAPPPRGGQRSEPSSSRGAPAPSGGRMSISSPAVSSVDAVVGGGGAGSPPSAPPSSGPSLVRASTDYSSSAMRVTRGGAAPAIAPGIQPGIGPEFARFVKAAEEADARRIGEPTPIRPPSGSGQALHRAAQSVQGFRPQGGQPSTEASPSSRRPGDGRVEGISRVSRADVAPEPLPPLRDGVDMDVWERIVGSVRAESALLASVLENAAPLLTSKERVVLAFPPTSFLHTQISEANHNELLTRVLREQLGEGATIAVELTDEALRNRTLSRIAEVRRYEEREAARKEAEQHPLVLAAIEMLGAVVRDVKID
ncbi:MAG: DNA polymerase III subunit gamma/tau [Polyangiaceae bacterium]